MRLEPHLLEVVRALLETRKAMIFALVKTVISVE